VEYLRVFRMIILIKYYKYLTNIINQRAFLFVAVFI